jgi:hypothetical protein
MGEGEEEGEGGAMEDRGGRDDRESKLPKSTLYTSDRRWSTITGFGETGITTTNPSLNSLEALNISSLLFFIST